MREIHGESSSWWRSNILGLFPGQETARFLPAAWLDACTPEDVMRDPRGTLGALCETIGLERAESLSQVSWNGQPLTEVYPWGTIRAPTPEANLATARILSPAQTDEIRIRARGYLDTFDYTSFGK
jgi:hypothetical protein